MASLSETPNQLGPAELASSADGPAGVDLAGDPRGLTAVELKTYGPDLLRRATMLTGGNASFAHDLVQDTFERALRNLDRVMPGSNVRAWLYTIMTHRFRDLLRTERVHRAAPLDDRPDLASREVELPPAWTAITCDQVRSALMHLSPELRVAFERREFEQLSYQRIADEMGVPVATVGTRLMRARQQLRTLLSPVLKQLDRTDQETRA